eukprot:gene17786-9464_t
MALKLVTVCTLCYCDYNIKHPYRVPKHLECEHTFCTDCISKLKDLQGQAVECPLCQKPTLIPSQGIDLLITNLDAVGLGKVIKQPEVCCHCVRKTYPPKPVTLFCKECDTSFCGNCSDIVHLKPENTNHVIVLESVKNRNSNTKAQQIYESSESRPSSHSSVGSKPGIVSRPSSSFLLDKDSIPECPVHGEKMKIYCRMDRCLCCSYCETIGEHRGHDCFQVHEAEEKERIELQKLQQKVDLHCERYIKARGHVQQMIEEVKQNSVVVKDVVRRYFRELRATIDLTEKSLIAQLSKRSDSRLKALREQLSKMIEISSLAKTASRNCDNALSYDYYEMLLRTKSVEEDIENVLEMMVATEPVASANLHCQFPRHESILNSIRTCAYIVEAPPVPSNFLCSINKEQHVEISWDDAPDMQYIYPALFYVLQASTEHNNRIVVPTAVAVKQQHIVFKTQLVESDVTVTTMYKEQEPTAITISALAKAAIK